MIAGAGGLLRTWSHRVGSHDDATHYTPKGPDGEDFKAAKASKGLAAMELTSYPKQLANANKPGFKPPGKPTKDGGKTVYPSFGQPS